VSTTVNGASGVAGVKIGDRKLSGCSVTAYVLATCVAFVQTAEGHVVLGAAVLVVEVAADINRDAVAVEEKPQVPLV